MHDHVFMLCDREKRQISSRARYDWKSMKKHEYKSCANDDKQWSKENDFIDEFDRRCCSMFVVINFDMYECILMMKHEWYRQLAWWILTIIRARSEFRSRSNSCWWSCVWRWIKQRIERWIASTRDVQEITTIEHENMRNRALQASKFELARDDDILESSRDVWREAHRVKLSHRLYKIDWVLNQIDQRNRDEVSSSCCFVLNVNIFVDHIRRSINHCVLWIDYQRNDSKRVYWFWASCESLWERSSLMKSWCRSTSSIREKRAMWNSMSRRRLFKIESRWMLRSHVNNYTYIWSKMSSMTKE